MGSLAGSRRSRVSLVRHADHFAPDSFGHERLGVGRPLLKQAKPVPRAAIVEKERFDAHVDGQFQPSQERGDIGIDRPRRELARAAVRTVSCGANTAWRTRESVAGCPGRSPRQSTAAKPKVALPANTAASRPGSPQGRGFCVPRPGLPRDVAVSLAASCRRAVRRGSHFSLVTFQSCCCRSSAATWAGVR